MLRRTGSGQTEKTQYEYVFRFDLKLGHCATTAFASIVGALFHFISANGITDSLKVLAAVLRWINKECIVNSDA